jgi:hypothetical protein
LRVVESPPAEASQPSVAIPDRDYQPSPEKVPLLAVISFPYNTCGQELAGVESLPQKVSSQ